MRHKIACWTMLFGSIVLLTSPASAGEVRRAGVPTSVVRKPHPPPEIKTEQVVVEVEVTPAGITCSFVDIPQRTVPQPSYHNVVQGHWVNPACGPSYKQPDIYLSVSTGSIQFAGKDFKCHSNN